jgi:hypothetical protein
MVKWLDLDAIHFDEVYKLVLDAARKAFREAQEAHPDETFYAFGFYPHHHPRLGFMLPTYHSEEAHMRLRNLTEIERENQALEWFHMRWNPEQWEYHYSGQEHFASVWQWVKDNLDGYIRPRDQDLLRAFIDYNMSAVYLNVLKALDEEELFGRGPARENIVLFILGVRHHDRFEHARFLNPTPTYKRWRIEIEASEHARDFFNPIPLFDPDWDLDSEDDDVDLDSQ